MERAVRLVMACVVISGCTDEAAPLELIGPSSGLESTLAASTLSMNSVSASQFGDGARYEGRYHVTLDRRALETEVQISRGDALGHSQMDLGHSVRLSNTRLLDVTLPEGRNVRLERDMPALHTRRMPNGQWLTAGPSAEAARRRAVAAESGSPGWEGRRGPRLFEPGDSEGALVRLATASESRRALDAHRQEFTMRRGTTISVIVFDRRIGGVVRATISDPKFGVITTVSSYKRVAGGYVLVAQDMSVRARGVERTTRNVFEGGIADGGTQ